MKKFFGEFKKFITRGNVLDMAVGVIVGGAFTAIVNGLSNNILKPLINYFLALILGKNALSEVYTFLNKSYLEDGVTIDLANSIYIDWGAFINAIINFIIVALVLFLIIRFFNKMAERRNNFIGDLKDIILTKAEKNELKNAGVNYKDRNAVKKYYEDKHLAEEQAKKAEEEAKKREEEEKKANSPEVLLKEIRDLLKAKID